MSARRIVGSALSLLVVSGCAQQPPAVAPRPNAPQDGPSASIRATYTGGLIYRTVDASFRVEQDAFVLVAHLGGDGVIRVLYPTSARSNGFVRGKKTVRVPSFAATYDGAPGLMTFSVSPIRNTSSRMDSYDGGGHGFIFVIASRDRFDLDEISDGFEFDEVDVANYNQAYDPRRAIRDFAEHLAGGPFTLRFANSFSTYAFTTYAARAWDCSVLASRPGLAYSYGLSGLWGVPGPWWLGYSSRINSRNSYCGDQYAFGHRDYYWRSRWYAQIPTVTTPTTGLPIGPITPTLTRPPRRPITEPGRAVVFDGRSSIERPSPTTRGSRNNDLTIRRRDERPTGNEASHRRTTDRPPSRTRDDVRSDHGPRSTGSTESRSSSSGGEVRHARPTETRSSSSGGEVRHARPTETRSAAPAREASRPTESPREAPRPAPAPAAQAEKPKPGN